MRNFFFIFFKKEDPLFQKIAIYQEIESLTVLTLGRRPEMSVAILINNLKMA